MMRKSVTDWFHWRVVSSSDAPPCADIVLEVQGEQKHIVAEGGGAVDAAFKAIESVVDSHGELLLYSVNNITTGTDSQGEVTVRLSLNGRIVNGLGVDTDIVIASVKAYINALNKLHSTGPLAEHPQLGDII